MVIGVLLQLERGRLTAEHQRDVVLWGGILIGLVVAGWVGISILRRHVVGPSETSSDDSGFTLSELREMRQRGDLTEAEFAAAKEKLIARTKGKPQEPPESSAVTRGD